MVYFPLLYPHFSLHALSIYLLFALEFRDPFWIDVTHKRVLLYLLDMLLKNKLNVTLQIVF